MSPELVDLTSEFIDELCKRLPVILIPGNHDANLNNKNRLDALTPIIALLQNSHKNLHYYKESKIYEYDNIDFIVRSLLDNQDIKEDLNNCRDESTKIILYHGTVEGSKTDLGYTLSNNKINIASFNGADIALLGDVHLRQKLQNYHVENGVKMPTIAYAGSYLQQDFGEGYNDHGVLLWNIKTRQYEEINIQNDYGYYTIQIKNNKIVSDTSDMPNSPRLRAIILDDTSKIIAQELIHDLKKKCNIQSVIINELKNKSNTISLRNDSEETKTNKIEEIIGNVKNVSYQNELFTKYLKQLNPEISADILNEIYKINEKLNKNIKIVQESSNSRLKFLKFEFSNMFSYGENNVIDFEKLQGVVGLFGQNKTGKSSVLSAILFCLFDKCERTSKAISVLNFSKDTFHCKLEFLLNQIKYTIERNAIKDKKGKVSVAVEFGYYDTDNTYISLNGDKRDSTNEIIRSYIGSYDNLVLTSMAVQGNDGGLINMTQAKRKDLFSDFIDVRIFDSLLDLSSKENKNIISELSLHKNKDYLKDIDDLNANLVEYNKNLTILNTEYEAIKNELSIINDDLISETKNLIKIDNENENIDLLEKNKNKLISDISNHEIKINIAIENVNLENQKITTLNEKLKKYDFKLLTDKKTESDDIKIKLDAKLKELNNIIQIAKNQKEKIDHLNELEYDEKCPYCMNNVFVKDALSTKEEFANTKKIAGTIKSEYDDLETKYSEYEQYLTDLSEYETKFSELSKEEKYVLPSLINAKKTTELELQSYKDNLLIIKNKIVKFHENEENINKNKETQRKIEIIKIQKDNKTTESEKKNKEINNQSITISIALQEIKRLEQIIERIKELEIQNTAYSYYIQCVHRQGIPYELISIILPVFEQEINDILHQMIDFEIRTEVDGTDVNFFIDYGDGKKWLIELTSGFERFVSSIAIRVALLQLSNLPKLTGFIIDEGFSSSDSDNLSNFPALFEYLKQYFDFILIVTHIDSMKDAAKEIIEITQIDGCSSINNSN
jgi:DNA repair exonuclease SbcCD ATPase subunit